MNRLYCVLALLLVVLLGYVAYESLRAPTPAEIIAAAFTNGDDALNVVESLSDGSCAPDEAAQELHNLTWQLHELRKSWENHSDQPSSEMAQEILRTPIKQRRIQRMLAEAMHFYDKLRSVYRRNQPFRSACEGYLEEVQLFPGLKAAMEGGSKR